MRCVGLLIVTALGLPSPARAEDPAKKYQVVTPQDDGIIAAGINARGEIAGFLWLEEKDRPGVLAQEPIFAKGKNVVVLPLLKGYTATAPAALSDDGLVVGRASKPLKLRGTVALPMQAVVWDAKAGIRGLGTLDGDISSFATGITRDGRRISGASVGANRVRGCIWDRDGDAWKATALPQADRLGSHVVAISDDGQHVAAIDGVVPCLWSREASGSWKREVIGAPGSLVPRAVNNAGTVCGLRATDDGEMHAVFWTRQGGMKQIEKPEGFVRSEANAVNNLGVIVGMIDGPRGSKVGPRAFVLEGGRLRLMDEGGPNFITATAINDAGQVAGVLEKDDEHRETAAGDPPAKSRE